MGGRKVYKINENQLKLIVESQKSSPQLQTEAFDHTAQAFGKLLSWGFKQSINAFKYFAGIGVNVYHGKVFTTTGKYPVKKQNPLAPLSLYSPQLTGMPKNYQNLFTTIYNGLPNISNNQTQPTQGTQTQQQNNNTDQQTQGQGTETTQGTQQTASHPKNLNDVINNLKFDNTNAISYPLKFKFQNLKREAKENSELMMVTWNLVFNVTCSGNITNDNQMNWELVEFSSHGPDIEAFLSQSKNNKDPLDRLFKTINYSKNNTNELSLIFSNQGQSQKFANSMTKQIQSHMKILIGQLNAKMGVRDAIHVPQITVTVINTLVGDVNIQPQNQNNISPETIQDDLNEVLRQIQLYKGKNPEYTNKLNAIANQLGLKLHQLNK